VGLTVLLMLPLYARLPYVFNQIGSIADTGADTFWPHEYRQVGLCAMVMIVPTILQGVTLPAARRR